MPNPGPWLDLAAETLHDPAPRFPVERVAAQLLESFELVGCSFNDRPPAPGVLRLWPDGGFFGGLDREIREWTAAYGAWEHPLLRYYSATDDPEPVHLADVPERFADRRVRGAWHEFAGPGGFAHQILLPLGTPHAHHRAFSIVRADPFTPQEQDFAWTVWRLLGGLDRQAAALARARCEVATQVRLTPRQTAVLVLVAGGLTAATVARRLAITERTVHKHLEAVYHRIGVHDRLSAVLWAQRSGLLGGVGPADRADPPPDRDARHGRSGRRNRSGIEKLPARGRS
jgi:DNA-binding CsgD family transcriptional regulator